LKGVIQKKTAKDGLEKGEHQRWEGATKDGGNES
jgi:hypothetical protein